MATVKQYILQLRTRQRVIAEKLGCDIGGADTQTRVGNVALLALLAVLIKTLTDKGVISDQELLATLNAARDDGYDPESSAPRLLTPTPPPSPQP